MKNFVAQYSKYLIAVLALVLGWYGHNLYSNHTVSNVQTISKQVRENSADYKFINPLLFVTDVSDAEFPKYNGLKSQIANYVSDANKSPDISDVSVYYKNLNGNEWFGVNQDDIYAPSSMMKVATLIAYLKLADVNSNILSEQAYYTPKSDEGQFYKPKKKLSAGSYTIKDLLQQMIIYSDNDALFALNALHTEEVLKVYKDLQLPDPLQDSTDFMSPRAYSRIFRALYNGSYISKANSEWALELLSYTDFDYGIRSGVIGTIVSDKFGELTNLGDGIVTSRELHDCGIVYYTDRPYFLCVMTKGNNFEAQQKIISDISKMTFDFVKANN